MDGIEFKVNKASNKPTVIDRILRKKSDTILVGYPAGNTHSSGLGMDELARLLSEGKYGEFKVGWKFLQSGLKGNKGILQYAIRRYFEVLMKNPEGAKKMLDEIGRLCVESVKSFVGSSYYESGLPNEAKYLRRKFKKHGEKRPLIVTKELIDACEYKIMRKQ